MDDSTADADRSPTGRVARSRVACQACHRRKVRCDVAQTGQPCSNCRHERGEGCTIVPRKKHRPRRPRVADGQTPFTPPEDGRTRSGAAAAAIELRPETGDDSICVATRATSPEAEGRLPDDYATPFIGDDRGPRQWVYDLCHPQTPQETRPAPTPTVVGNGVGGDGGPSWRPHEMDYLRHEGAFEVLPPDICDDLLRVYFAHVHFFVPILDVAAFVDEYERHGCRGINPLLYWSMFLAAANFVPKDVLARAGFASRKQMKDAMYARAKSLYDLDRSTNKVTLIQAVLLMGFWYTDAHDHTGAWHWVGIAISLAQSLGFHRRLPDTTSRHHSRGQREDQLRHASLVLRIWWTCVVRDCWVSLAKGRPMRIHDEDCDVPLPQVEDVVYTCTAQSHILPPPAQASALARMWPRHVRISALLGRIVRSHYRVQGPRLRREDVDAYDRELQACGPSNDSSSADVDMEAGPDGLPDDHLLLHKNHIDLFYNATVAILYRPYLLQAPASLPLGATEQWQKMASRRARAAASSSNDVLNRLIEIDAIHLLKQMTITALVPAMQIHLFDCKSPNLLLRRLGKNKLGLCMLVLSHIRNTYWSASVIYRLFARAQQILEDAAGESPSAAAAARATTSDDYPGGRLSGTRQDAPYGQDQSQTQHQLQQHQHQHQPRINGQETPETMQQSSSSDNNDLDGFVVDMPTPAPSHRQPQPPPLQMGPLDGPSWWDEPLGFHSVDHLLSPGFALSDDLCNALFQGYGSAEPAPDSGDLGAGHW